MGLPAGLWAATGLLLGLLATAAVVVLERHNLEEQAHLQLAQIASRSANQVQRQFELAGLLLRGMQSAYSVSGDIDQPRFAAIARNLRANGGSLHSMVALAFAPRIDGALAGQQQQPHYPYRVVAPVAGNERLVGFDIAGQPSNLLALQRARDIDQPVMSAAIPLLQKTTDRDALLGLIVRLPVYSPGVPPVTLADRRQREIGALGLSMRVKNLILDALSAEAMQRFRVRADDITLAKPQLLFDSGGATITDERGYGRVLEFGERQWRLSMIPHAATYDTSMLWAVGIGGVIASLLLASLLWSVANTRRRAVALGQRMSARFRESEHRFRTLNDLLPALVLMARAEDGRVVYANQAASLRLGGLIETANLDVLFEDAALQRRLFDPSAAAMWSNVDAVLKTLNGDSFWASTSISRVHVGGVDKLLMVANDISEQRQLTELLSYQATHDTLTELFNRREFERRVQRALFGASKGEAACALIYIDLDQFKLINDTSGHRAGDQLLSQLALVMTEQLRAGDILARLGGDEFGILAHGITIDGAQALAERLRSRIEGYIYVWEQRSYTISASLGVVLLDRAGLTLAEVMSHADAACYMAKDRGRNRIHFYAEQADETIRRRGEMEWANRLRWVIEEGRLLLDYQEVQPLQGQPDHDPHIELLIRLRDEDGKIVMPGAFLPAAERYGMMPLLDRWVVGEAISNFERLHISGRAPGRCSLNLAASTLEDDDLADYLLDLIERHGVAPSRLCFEITETEAVRNLARAVRFIERLRSVGCQVALDDFGAGMSSFGYLKNLPVDVIKIDGSFIRDLDADPMNRSIVNAITTIGHQRGMDVVAEWVSSQANAETLRSLGVDYGQGFALHRPERVLYQRVHERGVAAVY
jgi:diguanylate cyclase (GGDEF)-like protein